MYLIIIAADEKRGRDRNGSWVGHASDLYEFVGLNPQQQHGRRDGRQLAQVFPYLLVFEKKDRY